MSHRCNDIIFAIILAQSCLPVRAADNLELEGTTITGTRELPKVLHIVPWRAAAPAELSGRPMRSLVDEIMAPVDRDVMKRELEYYEMVHGFEQGASVKSNDTVR
jgi:hypothetical protein